MTNNIYPPDHLLRKWEQLIIDEGENVDVVLYEAFQAGADQELEACISLMLEKGWMNQSFADNLRAARRPKSPSLKEQALELVDRIEKAESVWAMSELDTIRRALESLPD